jgi:hypothetical protein
MNFERLKQAIAIIDAINGNRVQLSYWQHRPDVGDDYARDEDEVTCGTIACAGGWLALSTAMQEQGLRAAYDGSPIVVERDEDTGLDVYLYGFSALARFFDISQGEAEELFGARTVFEKRGSFEKLTDKEVWLKRAEYLMEEYKG